MLAIVIPYYKLAYFEATLASLASQTDKRFKVYIGDDASPENPSGLLSKFDGKFNFTYQRFEHNLGNVSLAKQWERCITSIKDEAWIMVLGDDDYLGDDVVEKWYKHYDGFYGKTELIRFSTKMIVEETQQVSELYIHPVWEKATDAYLRKYKHETRSSLSEYIFSRKTYSKYGFYNFPLAWNSDDRAWLDFSDNKPIFTINDSIVYFRLSNFNISGKTDNIYLKSLSQISFYKYLISEKLKFYKKHQKINFLRRYESEIGNISPLKFSNWLFLSYYYIKYFDFKEIKKFLKRFLNTILRRHE